MKKVDKMSKLCKNLGLMSGFIFAGMWVFNVKHLELYARQTIYINNLS